MRISEQWASNIYDKFKKFVYEEKKFSTVSDCITQALLIFVDYHHDVGQFRELFRDTMSSYEGRKFMKNTMKEVLLSVIAPEKRSVRC